MKMKLLKVADKKQLIFIPENEKEKNILQEIKGGEKTIQKGAFKDDYFDEIDVMILLYSDKKDKI